MKKGWKWYLFFFYSGPARAEQNIQWQMFVYFKQISTSENLCAQVHRYHGNPRKWYMPDKKGRHWCYITSIRRSEEIIGGAFSIHLVYSTLCSFQILITRKRNHLEMWMVKVQTTVTPMRRLTSQSTSMMTTRRLNVTWEIAMAETRWMHSLSLPNTHTPTRTE